MIHIHQRIRDPELVISEAIRLRNRAVIPRWDWSGVDEIVPASTSEALMPVVALLPKRKSTVETIVAELRELGGRYHRNLHQDEFGPTRTERMQALRDLIEALSALSSKLEALPPETAAALDRRSSGSPTFGGAEFLRSLCRGQGRH
jgi:hypothetical protein